MTRFIIIIFFCLSLLACSKRQTIIIDGIVQSQQQLDRLDTSEIFSITRWPPELAPRVYEQWSKNLIIEVKTKKTETKLQNERHKLLNNLLDSVSKGADILIILNGMIVPQNSQLELRKLSPGQLDNAETMEWEAARKLYGSPARPITLIINTYDPKYNYNQ